MRYLAILLLLGSLAAQTQYHERYRPQFHFTPAQNFMNDANGMVYFQGEYHLFYQHNPEGNVWGHMSWGHAVSPDMVHWQNLPVAIPEDNDYMIFSGSSVVDEHNASGLCSKPPCLVAIYTAHKEGWQRQNIAYSDDRGRTWKGYSGNPVVDEKKPDFRDPKMFWYEPQKKWVLVTVLADERLARFYESHDLKHWKFLSEFGPAGTTEGQWECPDLVELPVEGSTGKKWVLVISRNPGAPYGGTGVQYFIGGFDGTKFVNETPDSQKLWADRGKDFYATQRFASLPSRDKRVIWMGWLGNWQYANKEPTSPWRGIQSIPRELFLKKCTDGLCLAQRPVKELHVLRGSSQRVDVHATNPVTVAMPDASLEAEWKMSAKSSTSVTITDDANNQIVIGFDPSSKQIVVDRTKSGEANFTPEFPGKHAASLLDGSTVKIHAFLDQTTLELFINDGERAISDRVYLSGPVKLTWNSEERARGNVWEIKSIWNH